MVTDRNQIITNLFFNKFSMKKITLFLLAFFCTASMAFSQEIDSVGDNGEIVKYRRSSLYSLLIKHSAFPYAAEIDSAFMAMPMPDKFNDHNLMLRSFESSAVKMKKAGKAKDENNENDSNNFLVGNQVAKLLVAKWFHRDPYTGAFDMSLIQERGFYDASQLDIANAQETTKGLSALGDAGEDLIGKTFIIINDITFVDKGENSAKAAGWIKLAGGIAGQLTGNKDIQALGDVASAATNEIDGFAVNITTYLWKLVWNQEIAATFYGDYWNDGSDAARKTAFENSDIFRIEYVGKTTTSAANLASKSFSKKSKSQQMLRVCARAVDKSIVELQREYEDFKVNVPIYKIAADGKTVEVQIGLKEGINEKSQLEVLMPIENEDGTIKYDKIGMIQPIKGQIWDNRFGALEEAQEMAASDEKRSKDEEAANLESALLTSTTFKVLSGANKIVPGCLVREVTIKRD